MWQDGGCPHTRAGKEGGGEWIGVERRGEWVEINAVTKKDEVSIYVCDYLPLRIKISENIMIGI